MIATFSYLVIATTLPPSLAHALLELKQTPNTTTSITVCSHILPTTHLNTSPANLFPNSKPPTHKLLLEAA